jgi:TM2 domain-containing membrane protein YozV
MPRTYSKCQSPYEDPLPLVCLRCGDHLPEPMPQTTEAIESGKPVEVTRVGAMAGSTTALNSEAKQILIIANPTWGAAEVKDPLAVSEPKSAGLAALLSFLLVGMGQVYLGQVEKGLCMLGMVVLLVMSSVLGPLGILILFFNVLDAFLLGRKVKAGRQIRKWQFFFQSK